MFFSSCGIGQNFVSKEFDPNSFYVISWAEKIVIFRNSNINIISNFSEISAKNILKTLYFLFKMT